MPAQTAKPTAKRPWSYLSSPFVMGLLAWGAVVAVLYTPVKLRLDVLGVLRPLDSLRNIHGHELKTIAGTNMCEDMHLHQGSNGPTIFAACEGDGSTARWGWFPGIATFKDPSAASEGYFVTIDPKTFIATPLTFTNFAGPFVTHGIDIINSPTDPSLLYIFAINHLPNPEYVADLAAGASTSSIPAARSQIELFEHTLGTTSVTHLRSILSPLITTPNDIHATNATSFYVTNDHYYRGGHLRTLEDVAYQNIGAWGNVIRVSISDSSAESTFGFTATVALSGIHNPNGLGKGATSSEVLIARAAAGVLALAEEFEITPAPSWYSFGAAQETQKVLKIKESIQMGSSLDNPTYFSDPYVAQTGRDASGYVLAGLPRACDLSKTHQDPNAHEPSLVWLLQRGSAGQETSSASQQESSTNEDFGTKIVRDDHRKTGDATGWEKKLIFQDDGLKLRTATTALIVAIDPQGVEAVMNHASGLKQGWLFVTGFLSHSIVAARIDL